MADVQLKEDKDALATPPRRSFLWRRLPFIAVLLLAIVGVAYMNLTNTSLVGYWEILALAMAILCIVMGWDGAASKKDKYRLIGTQALHWLAILLTMNMVLYSNLQQMLPAPATSLVLLTLLALGAFLAGVNLLSPEIGFLGVAMAAAVPAIVFLKQSALFLLLGAVLVMGIALSLRPKRRGKEEAV